MKFIQARNYTPANRVDLRLVVIHTMENPEKPDGAENVAAWLASVASPKASAHLCVDSDSVAECVKPQDVAWAAPGANRDGYHIEHAGRAQQSTDQWRDEYSASELVLSARAIAHLCVRYRIPPRKLSIDEVRDGHTKGFCGHRDVTLAFHTKGGHSDPGPNFPWTEYLVLVANAIGEVLAATGEAWEGAAP